MTSETRALAADNGLVVAECSLTIKELLAAQEVFIAGTACGIIGVVCLDRKDIGVGTEGPVTRALRERYQQLTRDESP